VGLGWLSWLGWLLVRDVGSGLEFMRFLVGGWGMVGGGVVYGFSWVWRCDFGVMVVVSYIIFL